MATWWKKQKQLPMTSEQLNSHSQALYSLLPKPYVKSSPSRTKAYNDIKALADCLLGYKNSLDNQASIQEKNRNLDHPVRTVGENTTVEHRQKTTLPVKNIYGILDTEVKKAGHNSPVFVDESIHLTEPFSNPLQRHRFYASLQLSVDVDMYRFCPGGSIVTTTCIVQVNPDRSETQILTEAVRFALEHKSKFREFHTRSQRRVFKEKLNNVAKIQPSVVDMIYKELALDSSTVAHPDTYERIRLIFLGEQGLLPDLRKLNVGRPSGAFDEFFDKMSELVEEVTAADDRRHNVAHLSGVDFHVRFNREDKRKMP